MNINTSKGFTLIEMMIAVAIIAILAAIAVPSYQGYQVKTKRSQMMVELQEVAAMVAKQKVIQGNYSDIDSSKVLPDDEFPKDDTIKLYTVTIADLKTGEWTLKAVPIAGTKMADDGKLTLNHKGYKCRDSRCGTGKEWKD